jgi:hypothetical protein
MNPLIGNLWITSIIYENPYMSCILFAIILVIIFLPKKKENFHYIGMHNYHKDSYKLGLHGKPKKNYLNFSNLRFYDFLQLINFFVL